MHLAGAVFDSNLVICPLFVCAGKNTALLHSPGSVNEGTKKVSQTGPHCTMEFQPIGNMGSIYTNHRQDRHKGRG